MIAAEEGLHPLADKTIAYYLLMHIGLGVYCDGLLATTSGHHLELNWDATTPNFSHERHLSGDGFWTFVQRLQHHYHNHHGSCHVLMAVGIVSRTMPFALRCPTVRISGRVHGVWWHSSKAACLKLTWQEHEANDR